MEDLVRYIVSHLADEGEYTITSESESDKVVIINIKASKDSIGKIIGRNGKIANGIRSIVKSASLKSDKRYIVKVGEMESV